MIMPFLAFFVKELTAKCVLAYDDQDFKETVDAFVAGELNTIGSRMTEIDVMKKANSKASRVW